MQQGVLQFDSFNQSAIAKGQGKNNKIYHPRHGILTFSSNLTFLGKEKIGLDMKRI